MHPLEHKWRKRKYWNLGKDFIIIISWGTTLGAEFCNLYSACLRVQCIITIIQDHPPSSFALKASTMMHQKCDHLKDNCQM